MNKANLNTLYHQINDNRHPHNPAILHESMWVNAYEIDRAYGGPEEGGWWYNTREPLNSVKVRTVVDAVAAFDLLKNIHGDYYDDDIDIGSVIHNGTLVIYLEDHEGEYEPKHGPHYE